MTDLLRDLFAGHDGYLTDKWQHYIGIYERELAPLVILGRPVSLLEIGVQNGGSLQIWSRYLPPGSRVAGLDTDPACAALRMPDNAEIMIGNATDPAAVQRLLGGRTFDIIIDDGSHRSPDVIAAFETLFDRLNGGGLYFAEDLHCSYLPAYGGGFRTRGSSIEWFKDLVEAINFDHATGLPAMPPQEAARMVRLNRAVARLAFYDSVAVIEKHAEPKDAPYRRVMSGRGMPIAHPGNDIYRSMTPKQIRDIYLSASATEGFSASMTRFVADAKEALLAAQQERARAGAVAAELQKQVADLQSRDAAAALERGTLQRSLQDAARDRANLQRSLDDAKADFAAVTRARQRDEVVHAALLKEVLTLRTEIARYSGSLFSRILGKKVP
jgi:hypothetical protein